MLAILFAQFPEELSKCHLGDGTVAKVDNLHAYLTGDSSYYCFVVSVVAGLGNGGIVSLCAPVTDLTSVLCEHYLITVNNLISLLVSGSKLLIGYLGLFPYLVLLISRCHFLHSHKLVFDAIFAIQVPKSATS